MRSFGADAGSDESGEGCDAPLLRGTAPGAGAAAGEDVSGLLSQRAI